MKPEEILKTGILVIIRHGESEFNKEDRWAGWIDTLLTEKGRKDAFAAGVLIRNDGFMPDVVYTTSLSRAKDTAAEVLRALGIPTKQFIENDALMERHYGALTGLNKAQMKVQLGDEMFTLYRRSYDTPPPPMNAAHPHHPSNPSTELKVIGLPPNGRNTESLADVVERVIPFWQKELLPRLQKRENVLISAHGNSLRALSMIIERMTPEQIQKYEIANATPIMISIRSTPGEESWQFLGKQVMQGKGTGPGTV